MLESPTRPLGLANRANTRYPTSNSPTKQISPDLEDMARQMNITPPRPIPSYHSPLVTVLAFNASPGRSASQADVSPSVASVSSKRNASKDSKGYEYLCRIQAIKQWLEAVLGEPIKQSPAELISYIRNGILLAKLANVFLPTKKPVYTNDSKLEFRHTENINRFFRLLNFLQIPALFHFELTDLYDAKDVPKVWFCLHAISYKINSLYPQYPKMETLVGTIDFDVADVKVANRALAGHHLPNFASADDVSSPGISVYMNRALSVSPQKEVDTTNPFLETKQTLPLHSPTRNNPRMAAVDGPTTLLFQTPPRPKSNFNTDIKLSAQSVPDLAIRTAPPDADSHTVNVVKIQALAKGSLLRYQMFVKKIMLKSYDSEFTTLFSVIRGNISRSKTVHRHRDDLIYLSNEICRLQSAARGHLVRRQQKFTLTDQQISLVTNLQTLIRSGLVAKTMSEIRSNLSLHSASITELQAYSRAKTIHQRVKVLAPMKLEIEPSIIALQAAARRCIFNSRKSHDIHQTLANNSALIELQAIGRGGIARNRVRTHLMGLFRERSNLCELQTIARGAILRTRLCNNVLITLLGADLTMNRLFAKVRGNAVRRETSSIREELQLSHQKMVVLQSTFRGILLRFNCSADEEDIYDNIGSLIELQAIARANKIRKEFNSMDAHYSARVDQVVRCQAILRSRYTQTAYKQFISMQCPPLAVVRKFAHLLLDSGTDFKEELELSKLKDEILEKSKSNEELEGQIELLDIKLGLLDKNKISIEDFMETGSKVKTVKPQVPRKQRTFNKSVQRRVELLLTMFYFLQTKPSYFVKMYNQNLPSCKENTAQLRHLISLVFPMKTVEASREGFFFVRFLSSLMEQDMLNSTTIADITKIKNTFWIDHVVDLHKSVHQRSHLKKLLGPTVHALMGEDITFESDPVKIHQLIRKQEIKVNGCSSRPQTISAQDAIKDKEVSAAFINNLMALRDSAGIFVERIKDNAGNLPIHIRHLARQAYKLTRLKFPNQGENLHLSVAGVILIKHYVSNILHNPENYGYKPDPLSSPERVSSNLKCMSRVLIQVFSMKPFSDNFLRPLNDFVLLYVEDVKALIKFVIDTGDLETAFKMNEYDDLVADDRPLLTMKVTDMVALEKIVRKNLDAVCSPDDQLRIVVENLDNLVNSANDYVSLADIGTITLQLSPTSQEDSVANARYKALYLQAKRSLLYMMRVQDSDDMLELLIQRITPEHEEAFKALLNDLSQQESRVLGLSTKSYVEMKKTALNAILQLENMGEITRKDSYQGLLNQLVMDIKTKDTQRVDRKSQLRIARETILKLARKELLLKKQLRDYNAHIDRVLEELQRKPKDKKLFNIIPVFSKQYFYHRQLKRTNRLPKFGSYKYSAKKLTDQGVLRDMGGALMQIAASSSKLEFVFSCHKQGHFVIEVVNGAVTVPGASGTITLDQLLDQQYEKKAVWQFLGDMVTFDTDALSALIFRIFYDIKKN